MQLESLIKRLADGAWHRVENADDCGTELAGVGLELEIQSDRCRLPYPIDVLSATAIASALPAEVQLDVAAVVDSTNTRLLRRPPPPAGTTRALLAEFQYGGRGRCGRAWVSPYGSGICLSLAQLLEPAPREPGRLSLVIGVAALRALRQLGLDGAGLKWPNDLVYAGAKLGGVLLEAAPAGAALHVVAGIGINLRLPEEAARRIAADGGIAATDLNAIDPGYCMRRNELAAALINHAVAALAEYRRAGFALFREEWNDADVLKGCEVKVSGAETVAGVAGGIDAAGALMVRAGNTTHHVVSGDVRVRSV